MFILFIQFCPTVFASKEILINHGIMQIPRDFRNITIKSVFL